MPVPFFRRILVPHDFSPQATVALRAAAALAREHRGRLTVLHVIVPFYVPADVSFGLAADTLPVAHHVRPGAAQAPRGARRPDAARRGAAGHLPDRRGRCLPVHPRRRPPLRFHRHEHRGPQRAQPPPDRQRGGEGRPTQPRTGAHHPRPREEEEDVGRACERAPHRAADRPLHLRRRLRDRPAARAGAGGRGRARDDDVAAPRGAGASGLRDAAGARAARHPRGPRRLHDRDRDRQRSHPRVRRRHHPAPVAARLRARGAARAHQHADGRRAARDRGSRPARAPARAHPARRHEARPEPVRRGLLRHPGRSSRPARDHSGAAGAGPPHPRGRVALRGQSAVGRRDRRRVPHPALLLSRRSRGHRVERRTGDRRCRFRGHGERAGASQRPAPGAALLRRRPRPLHDRDLRARHRAGARVAAPPPPVPPGRHRAGGHPARRRRASSSACTTR